MRCRQNNQHLAGGLLAPCFEVVEIESALIHGHWLQLQSKQCCHGTDPGESGFLNHYSVALIA